MLFLSVSFLSFLLSPDICQSNYCRCKGNCCMCSMTHTLGRTLLDEGLACRRDLYLTAHNRQTSLPPAGFEHAFPVSKRAQTRALDEEVTWIGFCKNDT